MISAEKPKTFSIQSLPVLRRIALEGSIEGGRVVARVDRLEDRTVCGAEHVRQRGQIFLGAGPSQPLEVARGPSCVVDQAQKTKRPSNRWALFGEMPNGFKALGVMGSGRAPSRYRWIKPSTAFG